MKRNLLIIAMLAGATVLWAGIDARDKLILNGVTHTSLVSIGVTAGSAYDGAQGASVSNQVATHTTQIGSISGHVDSIQSAQIVISNTVGSISNNALYKTFTNDAAVTALRVTGGSPTNRAIFYCTNTATGQGAWTALPKIDVEKTGSQVFPHAYPGVTAIYFDTTVDQVGGIWDTTNWTPNVIGWVQIDTSCRAVAIAGSGYLVINLLRNGVVFREGAKQIFTTAVNYPSASGSFKFKNLITTNKYSIAFGQYTQGGPITNQDAASAVWMSGAVLP